LTLAPGEIHALCGENGAGKSTLLGILAGALAPDAGVMELDGVPYAPHADHVPSANRGPRAARAAGLAMIHQELALAPHLSVAENVLLGAEPVRRGARGVLGIVDRTALAARARAALDAVGCTHLALERPVATLAPADRQRVEIARALALDARVLVLDEPTSSLARADVGPLFARLRELAARGVAIVYVSHVLEEVFELCTRATVLRDGVTVAELALADTTPDALVAAMVGRSVRALYPRSPPVDGEPGEVVLRIERLAGRRLPRAATLALRRGEVLGIAGVVGAGRTECLRAVFGLDSVRSGEIAVLGHHGARGPSDRWAAGAGFASEDRKLEGLALARSVAENLLLPVLGRGGRAGLTGFIGRGALARRAEPWIAALGVRCASSAQACRELSGGNQQKVALARLLAAECDVLLLDEPTRGIDVGARAEIYAWIDRCARQEQKAVLLVSSSLPELVGLSDRIAVMCRGTLGPARPVGERSEHELLLAMTGVGAGSEGESA
jgi:ribose transport system ATP-binding protein